MAVTHEVFTDKVNAGKAGRSNAKRPTNSAAMCWASAALPPFPNRRALFPCCRALIRTSLTFATTDTRAELCSRSCFVAIEASISLITRGSKSLACFIHPPRQGSFHIREDFDGQDSKITSLQASPYVPSLLSLGTALGPCHCSETDTDDQSGRNSTPQPEVWGPCL